MERLADPGSVPRREGYGAKPDLVERVVETRLPTRHGEFRAVGCRVRGSGLEVLAMVKGTVAEREAVPAGVHVACLVSDALGAGCGCAHRLIAALRALQREACGVLVYLPRNVGLDRPWNRARAARHQRLAPNQLQVFAGVLEALQIRSASLLEAGPASDEAGSRPANISGSRAA